VANDLAHVAARNGRRVAGIAQAWRADVTGTAPSAVLRAIKTAHLPPRGEDRAVVERIELVRNLLLTSPRPLDLSDMPGATTTSISRMAAFSKPPRWAFLLYRLVREAAPVSCLELGTCVGISAAYQGSALDLNGKGRLVSLEGAKALAAQSRWTLDTLDVSSVEVREGHFSTTLDGAVADLEPIDYAFIDGNHERDATLEYAELLLDKAAPETIHVFDDINWSEGMADAWASIQANPRYAVTFDLRSVGIAVASASATTRRTLSIGYY
jgi:predicted O-methyltransferase YrrM